MSIWGSGNTRFSSDCLHWKTKPASLYVENPNRTSIAWWRLGLNQSGSWCLIRLHGQRDSSVFFIRDYNENTINAANDIMNMQAVVGNYSTTLTTVENGGCMDGPLMRGSKSRMSILGNVHVPCYPLCNVYIYLKMIQYHKSILGNARCLVRFFFVARLYVACRFYEMALTLCRIYGSRRVMIRVLFPTS